MKAHKTSVLYEWQIRAKKGGVSCRKCGDTRAITVEHIIPLHWVQQFCLPGLDGMNWEDNFEYLCMVCNREKGGTIDPRHPKTYKLLAELIRGANDYHIKN